jgi:hypothetical protein
MFLRKERAGRGKEMTETVEKFIPIFVIIREENGNE